MIEKSPLPCSARKPKIIAMDRISVSEIQDGHQERKKNIISRGVWHQDNTLGEAAESSSLVFFKTGPKKAAAD